MDKIFSSLTWILRRLRRRKEATDTPAGLRNNKKSLSLEPSSDSSGERRQRNISQSSTFSGEERRREESGSRTEAGLDCGSVSSQAGSREASLGSAGLERRSLSLSSNLQRRSDLAGSLFLDLDWSRGAETLSRELDHIKLISHNLNLPPPPGSYCVAKYK